MRHLIRLALVIVVLPTLGCALKEKEPGAARGASRAAAARLVYVQKGSTECPELAALKEKLNVVQSIVARVEQEGKCEKLAVATGCVLEAEIGSVLPAQASEPISLRRDLGPEHEDRLAALARETGEIYRGEREPDEATAIPVCAPAECDCEALGLERNGDPRLAGDCEKVTPAPQCDLGVIRTTYDVVRNEKGECVAEPVDQRPCTAPPGDPDRGCFDPDARILLADGKATLRASRLRVGDRVWNPVAKRPVQIVRVVTGPEKERLYSIRTSHGAVRVTATHPMRTTKGLFTASELSVGDTLVDSRLGRVGIVAIERYSLPAGDQVVNFELERVTGAEEDHYLVADGVVTGDLILQHELERRRAAPGMLPWIPVVLGQLFRR